MIPYSKLKITIRSCPNGFPFALNIKEVNFSYIKLLIMLS